jgi:hypothetical protein
MSGRAVREEPQAAVRAGRRRQRSQPEDRPLLLSFLPQFVDVDAGSVALQIATLGLVFILLAMLSDGLYALAAGSAAGGSAAGRASFGRSGTRRAGFWSGWDSLTAFSGCEEQPVTGPPQPPPAFERKRLADTRVADGMCRTRIAAP